VGDLPAFGALDAPDDRITIIRSVMQQACQVPFQDCKSGECVDLPVLGALGTPFDRIVAIQSVVPKACQVLFAA
jgi:hypothetical protein